MKRKILREGKIQRIRHEKDIQSKRKKERERKRKDEIVMERNR